MAKCTVSEECEAVIYRTISIVRYIAMFGRGKGRYRVDNVRRSEIHVKYLDIFPCRKAEEKRTHLLFPMNLFFLD